MAEFYSSLSPETVHWFLAVHHQNMRPGLLRYVRDAAAGGQPLVLEGSAVRPDLVDADLPPATAFIFLHAHPDILRARVHAQSGYGELDAAHRALVDAFLDRSLRDNAAIIQDAELRGLPCLDSGDAGALDRYVAQMFGRRP